MLWILIIIAEVALDRISKYLVENNIAYGDRVSVIEGFFYLTHHENFGAAWGILQNGRYFFIVVTIIVCIVMTVILIKSREIFLKMALSILIGGALGNLVDRIVKGGVTDFLDFWFGTYNYPTFNASDSFTVIGTILLSIYLLFIYKEKDQIKKE